jgi:hypothetical protein
VLVLGASEDVEDLAHPAGFPEPMAVHDHEIAHSCAWSLRHHDLLSYGMPRISRCAAQGIGAATDSVSALSRGPLQGGQ